MNSALHLERRFVHHGDLFAQLEDPILPVALSVEPRERCRKRRIVPTPRGPRRVMDQAQRAQRCGRALDGDRRPLAKAPLRSYRADAADEAPEPFACRAIPALGSAAGTVRIDREATSRERRESVPTGERQWRDGWNLALGKL